MKKININPRIARWSLALQNYQLELEHRSSEKMAHVDCLSRNVETISVITAEDELMYRQLTDPKLKELAEHVELRGSKCFSIIDGLLFRRHHDRDLFVVPDSMINSIIRIHHDDMGHVGASKTAHGILSHYWFPCLKLRVKQYIENYIKCLTYSLASGKAEGEMEIIDKETTPFKTVHIDHFGPLEETADGYKHILVVIDAYTKYVRLFAVKSTNANEVIASLESLFDNFGIPERIISDRGTAFSSNRFAELVAEKQIKHIMTAVASPWANGQVERVNRFMKSTLAKVINQPNQWKDKLSLVQHVINNTLNKAINSTPCKLLLGYEQRGLDDRDLRTSIDDLRDIDQNYIEEREKTRDLAQTVNRKLQEYNKANYDRRQKKIHCIRKET